MSDDMGKLNFQIVHALRQNDRKEIIQFILSARGRPPDNSESGIVAWILGAREWIVRGFTELTTDKARKK